jgi:predicted O-methyltransferase YrrM
MNIERALAIKDGWMSRQELQWLAHAAYGHSRIAEIGSWTGRSTRALVDNTKGTVLAVDTWLGSKGDLDDIVAMRGSWWAFGRFHHNLSDAFAGNKLSVMRMDSLKAAKELKDQRFDMIFIDANHTYEAVKGDILAWSKLLRTSGMLCGHDFTPQWPGVMQAVEELIPDYRLMENSSTDRTIWWTVKE